MNIPVIWKAITNTDYMISEAGEIYSKKSRTILLPQVNQSGYKQLTLYIGGDKVSRRIHRLVAAAFLGESNGLEVNHIDGNKLNNHYKNLEYVTSSENKFHAIKLGLSPIGSQREGAKINEDDVISIKEAMLRGLDDQEISELTGTVTATISKIRHGKRWTHVMPEAILPTSKGTTNNARGKQKLSADDIPVIREMYLQNKSLAEIGRLFKVHSGTINAIVAGKTWTNY